MISVAVCRNIDNSLKCTLLIDYGRRNKNHEQIKILLLLDVKVKMSNIKGTAWRSCLVILLNTLKSRVPFVSHTRFSEMPCNWTTTIFQH